MDTRKLIDFAMDDNGVEFRSQLYASIHDRVTAAIESKKQEIAQNLVTQESVVNEEEAGLHPAASQVLKHIKPEFHNTYKPHLRKDTFTGSYADRRDVLKAAENAGHMKEDVEKNEPKDDEKSEVKKSSFPSGKGPSIFSKDKSSSGGKTTTPKPGVTRHSSGDRY
jgi:hypothetical protein